MGLGERVHDLAGTSAFHDLRSARPPGLDLAGNAVARVSRRAAVPSFLAASNQTAAPAGAHVVTGGRHPDLDLVADLDGAFDSRKGFLLLPRDEIERHGVVVVVFVSVASVALVVVGVVVGLGGGGGVVVGAASGSVVILVVLGLFLAEARGVRVLAVKATAVGDASPAIVPTRLAGAGAALEG